MSEGEKCLEIKFSDEKCALRRRNVSVVEMCQE